MGEIGAFSGLGACQFGFTYSPPGIGSDASDFQCKETAGVPVVAVVCGFVLLIREVPGNFSDQQQIQLQYNWSRGL
jgi:hypothetical protein